MRYLTTIWEKDSISLWILELEICRSWGNLSIVVCIVPLIHAVIIMDGSTIQHKWDRSGMENAMFIKFLVGGFCGESIVAVSEFKYFYFEVWVACEGWFIYSWGS